MEPMSSIVIDCRILAPSMVKTYFGITFSLLSSAISAWSRDMTGLSNHALSAAPSSPLLTLLDALPTGILRRSTLSVRCRSVKEASPFKAVRVILAASSQYADEL